VYGPFFPGQNVGMATVQAVATLHTGAQRDTLTGPFTFQLTNLSELVVFAGSGTFSAARLEIEPLALTLARDDLAIRVPVVRKIKCAGRPARGPPCHRSHTLSAVGATPRVR
jgi:hypothetical protein